MPKVTGLGHVGLYVRDPAAMVSFYEEFLGMTVTGRGEEDRIVFLSARPDEEHHELALARSDDRHTDPQQVSFTVGSLADLRNFHAQIKERGYPVGAGGAHPRDPPTRHQRHFLVSSKAEEAGASRHGLLFSAAS